MRDVLDRLIERTLGYNIGHPRDLQPPLRDLLRIMRAQEHGRAVGPHRSPNAQARGVREQLVDDVLCDVAVCARDQND